MNRRGFLKSCLGSATAVAAISVVKLDAGPIPGVTLRGDYVPKEAFDAYDRAIREQLEKENPIFADAPLVDGEDQRFAEGFRQVMLESFFGV